MTIPKEGEVYHDSVFDSEVKILSVEEETLKIADKVSDPEKFRRYRMADWKHNVSVGRFTKKRDGEDIEVSKEKEEGHEEKEGIFDF